MTLELEVKATEAEGYKPVESRAISEGYCRRGAVRRSLSAVKIQPLKIIWAVVKLLRLL